MELIACLTGGLIAIFAVLSIVTGGHTVQNCLYDLRSSESKISTIFFLCSSLALLNLLFFADWLIVNFGP